MFVIQCLMSWEIHSQTFWWHLVLRVLPAYISSVQMSDVELLSYRFTFLTLFARHVDLGMWQNVADDPYRRQ